MNNSHIKPGTLLLSRDKIDLYLIALNDSSKLTSIRILDLQDQFTWLVPDYKGILDIIKNCIQI